MYVLKKNMSFEYCMTIIELSILHANLPTQVKYHPCHKSVNCEVLLPQVQKTVSLDRQENIKHILDDDI